MQVSITDFVSLEGCEFAHRYNVIRKLNQGKFGFVFTAKDKFSGEVVALKLECKSRQGQ